MYQDSADKIRGCANQANLAPRQALTAKPASESKLRAEAFRSPFIRCYFLMDEYTPFILATFFGFILLAYLLLAPVYRFLHREEEASKKWTRETLAKRYRDEPPAN